MEAQGSAAPSQQEEGRDEVFADEFYMYKAKVEMCPRQDIHSYSTCPYLHLNEQSAQRRDPQLYKYDSIFCYDLHNHKACKRGTNCPYSHNLFEYFLHPSRYRTRMCEYGANCKRELCFFAHNEAQLRPRTAVKAHSGGRRSGKQHRAAAAAAAAAAQLPAGAGSAASDNSPTSMASSPTVCVLQMPSLPLLHSNSGGSAGSSRQVQFEGPCMAPAPTSLGSTPQHSNGTLPLQMQMLPQGAQLPFQGMVMQQQSCGVSCAELLAPLECGAAGMPMGGPQQQLLLPGTAQPSSTQCMMAVSCTDGSSGPLVLPQCVPVPGMDRAGLQDMQQHMEPMVGYVIDSAGSSCNWSGPLLAQQQVLLPAQQQQLVLQPAQQQQVVLQPTQQVLLQHQPAQQQVLQPVQQQLVLQPAQQQVLLQPGSVLQAPQVQQVQLVPSSTQQLYSCVPLSTPALCQATYTPMGL